MIKLTVTVQGLPRGLVRFGVTTMRTGDRLQPEQLPALVYVPEPGFSGPAGTFQYLVEDGRGGRTEGHSISRSWIPPKRRHRWRRPRCGSGLRASGRVEDVETFLRLYPNSYLAAAAQRRRDELAGRNTAAPRRRPPATGGSPSAASHPHRAHQARHPPAPASPPVAEKPKPSDKVAALQPIVPPSEPVPAPPRRDLAMVVPPVAVPPPAGDDREFQDCPTCVRMVRIPAGSLMMGQGAKDPSALPAHKVALRSFALSQIP